MPKTTYVSSETRANLEAEIASLTRSAERIIERARSEGRDLDPSEERIVTSSLDAADEARAQLASAAPAERSAQMQRAVDALEGGQTRRHNNGTLQRGQTIVDFLSAGNNEFVDQSNELSIGRILRAAATGDWSGAPAETRAMSTGVPAAGGFTVPTALAAGILDLARANMTVAAAGATIVPIDGPTDVARLDGDISASWKAELAPGVSTDATFGSMQFRPKTVSAHTRMSLELAADGPGSEQIIRQSMAQAIAHAVDQAALLGTGTAPEPRGLRNTPGVATRAIGSNLTWRDLVAGFGPVRSANYEPSAAILNSTTLTDLQARLDTTGQPLQLPSALTNFPIFHSSMIPHTLPPSGNSTEAYVGDFSQLYIGLRTSLSFEIQRDLAGRTLDLLVAFWARVDIQIARPTAFAILTNILD